MLVLQAMQSLPSDARLLIVGEGPLRQRIEEEIACRGLGGRVTVQPRVPSSQVPDVLRRLHAVVLPSLTTPRWKEQFGRVLVESMACGIPVVGSSSGEIPHVVGDAGLIVPEGDAGALAHALQRLHDDTQLRQELRARGRERVLERFTNARVAEMTHAVYVKASGQA
jgi:glycosyltransferase involved in cell wall biosynthesis